MSVRGGTVGKGPPVPAGPDVVVNSVAMQIRCPVCAAEQTPEDENARLEREREKQR